LFLHDVVAAAERLGPQPSFLAQCDELNKLRLESWPGASLEKRLREAARLEDVLRDLRGQSETRLDLCLGPAQGAVLLVVRRMHQILRGHLLENRGAHRPLKTEMGRPVPARLHNLDNLDGHCFQAACFHIVVRLVRS
jgi:hypothetical protein